MIATLFEMWGLIVLCAAAGWMCNTWWIIQDNNNNVLSNMKAKYQIKTTTRWCVAIALLPISIPAGIVYGIYWIFRWYRSHIKRLKTAKWAQDYGDPGDPYKGIHGGYG